jgi:hypothetical protein
MALHGVLLLVIPALLPALLPAAVTAVHVIDRADVLNGKAFGKAGPYEAIRARVEFTVDPKLAANRIIADIDLAPKNAQGLVEFSADLYVLKPRDPKNGNGTALVEISNRGGKGLLSTFDFARGPLKLDSPEAFADGFLLEQGFTLVWIGWEFDVPPGENLMHLYAPIAMQNGATITGLVRSEWTGDAQTDVISLGDRAQIGYAVADAASPQNQLFVRETVAGERTLVPRDTWTFTTDSNVAVKGGFTPGRIYEVVYLAKDPVVAGLGPAAVRDFVSFLKYGGEETLLGDQNSYLKRAIGFGVSQSGRFLRAYLYDGFNADEKQRRVFDGVWAQVAGAGRGSFNERFAQPSRDGHPLLNVFYPVDLPPFDEEGLLATARRANVAPKLFLINGSYEYWGRAASLIHTTPDGKADAPPSSNTRIYYFSGSQHGSGSIPPRPAEAQNLTSTNDYRFGLRALLVAMQNWLKNGTEPPPSQYPRLSRGELVAINRLNFPKIAGVAVPGHKREAYRLDFAQQPPKAGEPFPTLVPQVDADGNDKGGIQMPAVAVPLATYTGWNLRSAKIGAPTELFSMSGSWIPFPATKASRESRNDPRASIEERYRDEQAYLDQIDKVAGALVRAGYLLEVDVPAVHERAEKEWAYRQSLAP